MPDSVHYKMFINGIWQDASDGKRFDSINPTTEKPWCSVPESTEEDVNSAVESAHVAFTSGCLLYTSPSPRDYAASRMPSSA